MDDREQPRNEAGRFGHLDQPRARFSYRLNPAVHEAAAELARHWGLWTDRGRHAGEPNRSAAIEHAILKALREIQEKP